MTTFERFERSIPKLMTELAPARVPEYFDDMLRETASHGQRPAWSYPERWLPVEITARPLSTRSFPWRPLAILALIALLVAAGLAVYIGSQTRLPPPFGVAGNGVLLYHAPGGAVVSFDPKTGSQATLASAADHRGEPFPSRDGQRVAYIPRSDEWAQIIVSRIDGSEATPLAGKYRGIESVAWSPDGRQLAITSFDLIRKSITIIEADGSAAHALDLKHDVWQMAYLADGRLAIIAAERPRDSCPVEDPNVSPCALFVVNADGTGLDVLIPAADFHGLKIDPSPDGAELVWVEWSIGSGTIEQPDAPGRLHVFDLATGVDRRVPDDAFPALYNINRAGFSPDGSAILFDFFEVEGDHWAVVPATGGAPMRLGQKVPKSGTDAAWAPDGRSVLARYPTTDDELGPSELWILDATGGGADRRLDVEVPYLPTWQRVAR
ncbi:MAG TPA: hypothetical protein VK867_08360 [Candidatus Limnocylindrales bacterium]|nr:hypothetical protein [Candidatus Limnocylindrales bacterium]